MGVRIFGLFHFHKEMVQTLLRLLLMILESSPVALKTGIIHKFVLVSSDFDGRNVTGRL